MYNIKSPTMFDDNNYYTNTILIESDPRKQSCTVF